MNPVFWRNIAVAMILFLAGFSPVNTFAQSGFLPSATSKAEPVAEPSPNDIKEFSRLLGDPRMVEWLRKKAAQADKQAIGENSENGSFREKFDLGLERTRSRIGQLAEAWATLPSAPSTITRIWQLQMSGGETLRSIAFILIFLFIGAGLEWLYWQYFTGRILRVEIERNTSLRQRVNSALHRSMLITGALIVFGIGSIGAFVTFDWSPVVQRTVLNLLISIIAIRVILAITKFVLAPRVPELRLVPLSSSPAKRLYNWFGLVAGATVMGVFVSDTITHFASIQTTVSSGTNAALAISVAIAIGITALMLVAVWRFGANVTKSARNEITDTRTQTVMLSVLIVTALGLWLAGASELMWTLIILGLIIPAISMVSRLINHLFDEAEGERPEDPDVDITDDAIETAEEETTPSNDEVGRYDLYRPITVRLVRFVLVIFALFALGSAWDINILSLSSSDPVSAWVFGVVVDVTVALLIADLIWVWGRTAIDRRLSDFNDTMGAIGGEGGGSAGPEARLATLLPILRKILAVTIFTMVGLSVLSSIGVNIAPLLAGAGVVGVAIGFGAQSLVRDIVSGIFFLLDDAFRVGEYIEMGELRGTVESMSLRSLRVRHHRGAVHTIPFGELKSLTNYSRDWVIMKLEFRVPFETDLKLIKKLIKQVAAELAAHEMYGKHFIQPLKSQGIRRMEEFNMVIAVKFMCTPGEQWLIRRDAYQRIGDVFRENGIELAQRNVKVEVSSDRPLTAEEEKAISGAVQEATEQQLTAAPAKDEP